MGLAAAIIVMADDTNQLLPDRTSHSIQSQKTYGVRKESYIRRENQSSNEYIDQVLSEIGFGTFQLIAFFLAGVTYVAYIAQTLTFSFASINLINLWNLNGVSYSLVSVVTCATNLIGENFCGYIADKHGRFWPYLFSLFVLTSFIAPSAFAQTFGLFLALRAVGAIGTGGIMVLVNPTLVEFLPVKNRGVSTILTGIVQAIGSCIAGGFAWWLIPRYTNGWRYYILFTAVATAFAFVFRIIFYMESPRYLVSKGKADAAWEVFSLIAKFNRKDLNQITNKEEFIEIVNSKTLLHQTNNSNMSSLKSFLKIFKQPYLRKTLCFLIIYNTQDIAYFGSTLFLPYSLKVLGVDPYFVSFIGFTAQIPGIALMAIIVEWPSVGRLRALRFFSILSAISFFVFGFVQNQIATPVLTVIVYFSIVPNQPLVMTYISESFPTEVRIKVLALVTTVSAINGFWTPFVSGYMADVTKVYPWLSSVVWGSMFFVQFLVSLILRHETRGKSLQDNIS